MRIICVSPEGILDTQTGEVSEKLELDTLLREYPGGIITGVHLYAPLCSLVPETLKDEGWTVSIHASRVGKDKRMVKGVTYISRMTYRPAKVGGRQDRKRPPAIKWTVLNLELFFDTQDTRTLTQIREAAESLVGIAERRGISPRHSPGSLGASLLRASGEWPEGRQPAPFFISKIAREHLPGNYYARSHLNTGRGTLPHCYYIDQRSSHHVIASTAPLPHPAFLRARGRLRSAEAERSPVWIDAKDIHYLRKQVGLLCCVIECGSIPPQQAHLYPPWTKEKGKHVRWIWTPELRLLENDPRVQIRHVVCALTSHRLDTALWEYAEWSLEQNERPDKRYYKASLLAAYGMLACRSDFPLHLHTVHGRKPSPRSEVVQLPLLPKVYRSTVKKIRVPGLQNVVTRGVIEAETRTRSLEYARQLEGEGLPVVHIYADGLLVLTDQLPLTIPGNWRVAHSLSNVYSPHPNTILSDQLTRMPGVIRNGRERYLKDGHIVREREPVVR